MHRRKTFVAANRTVLSLILAIAVSSAASELQAGVGDYLRAIRNPQPLANDQFGASLAATGRTLMISKRQDDSQVREGGSAYVVAGKSSIELAHVFNPTPDKFDTFGVTTVGYREGFLTGTWRDDNHDATDTGVMYRVNGAGDLQQVFFNPTPDSDDRFGWSVAGVGDNVVIGAYKDDQLGNDTGAAYLFDSDSGRLIQTFTDPTPTPGDRFGYSVASWESKVIIGCYRESQLAGNSGAVYIFDAITGALEQELFNPTPQAADYFGKSLAVAGDRLLVGAPKDDTAGLDAGAAYLFDLTTGSLLETLVDPTPTVDGEFAEVLSSTGNDFLVGAPLADRGDLIDVGAAYLFDGQTGARLASFENPEPSSYDFFGAALGGMVDEILIGAHMDDWGALDSGSVYVFEGRSDPGVLVGDADGDGLVTGADYLIWANNFGAFVGEAVASDGDFDNDGFVTGADFTIWADNWGNAHAVPEPSTWAWALSASIGLACWLSRTKRKR